MSVWAVPEEDFEPTSLCCHCGVGREHVKGVIFADYTLDWNGLEVFSKLFVCEHCIIENWDEARLEGERILYPFLREPPRQVQTCLVDFSKKRRLQRS